MAMAGRGGREASSAAASTSGGGGAAAAALGTTRSRTDAYMRYRRAAHGLARPPPPGAPLDGADPAARLVPLGADASDAEAGAAGAPAPAYVALQAALRADMAAIRDRMAELRALAGRAALSKFEGGRDDEVAVEVAAQAVTRALRAAEGRLLAAAAGAPRPGSAAAASADERVRANVQRTLAVELQRLSLDFRKQQKAYLARLRARGAAGGGLADADDAAAGGGGGFSDVSLLDDAPAGGFDAWGDGDAGGRRQQAQQRGGGGGAAALAAERDREVAHIVASISELGAMMKDLSALVIDQGSALDRIDYNLEQTAARVDEGLGQLRRAERAQRGSRAALCVLLLLAACGALLLMLLVKVMW